MWITLRCCVRWRSGRSIISECSTRNTALFGARAGTKCGLDFFGVDHVVFASDTPFEPKPGLYIRETIGVIESLGLTADEKDRIYRRNAERLPGGI